jgi:hypothetical protein
MELNNTLSLIAQGLLIIALPIVIAAAVQHFRVMTQQLKSKLNENQQQAIDRAVGIAVKAAEQVGGIDGLIGPEKKKQALQIAQSFLAERGINLDVTKLVNLIEAEVQTQFAKPAPVVDSAQARQALVDSAIQAAVQAAEQSGLTGLIQNLGPEKKAYALQLAGQYLGQYGIAIDPQLLSGLVESQVLRSTMQAQAAAAQVTPAPATYPPVSPTTGLQPGG